MPSRHLPVHHRRALRVLLAAAYHFALVGGVAMLLFTPRTIAGALGSVLTYGAACMLIAGAIPCLYAVALDKWRIERWATWLIIGGAGSYLLTIWTLVVTETTGRLAQACLVTVLLALLLYRAVEVDGTARQYRVVVEEARR